MTVNRQWAAVVVVALATGATYAAASCTPTQRVKYAKAETDLCKARAAYKVVALAAGGALDPAPGSARAQLEAAEDVFCANLALTDGGLK